MILFLPFIACSTYYIRMYKTEEYVTGKLASEGVPFIDAFEKAHTYEIKKSPADFEKYELHVIEKKDLAWDIALSKTKLNYYSFHGRNAQQYKLVPVNMDGVFNVYWNNLCLTYDKDKKNFETKTCGEENLMQQFEFLEAGKFKASGGSGSKMEGGACGGKEGCTGGAWSGGSSSEVEGSSGGSPSSGVGGSSGGSPSSGMSGSSGGSRSGLGGSSGGSSSGLGGSSGSSSSGLGGGPWGGMINGACGVLGGGPWGRLVNGPWGGIGSSACDLIGRSAWSGMGNGACNVIGRGPWGGMGSGACGVIGRGPWSGVSNGAGNVMGRGTWGGKGAGDAICSSGGFSVLKDMYSKINTIYQSIFGSLPDASANLGQRAGNLRQIPAGMNAVCHMS